MNTHAIAPRQKKSSATSSFAHGFLQRKCDCGSRASGGACEECKERKGVLQRSALSSQGKETEGKAPPIVHDVLRSPGRPLDAATRAYFEASFEHDFTRVRVHSDAKAAESARAVGARAFTVGSHVVLPASAETSDLGRSRLLAHELTHVVQQGDRDAPAAEGLEIASPSSNAENAARRAETADHARDALAGAGSVGGQSLLFRDETPRPEQEKKEEKPAPAPKKIVVDLGEQKATAFEGEKPVKTMDISSGRKGHPTPTGNFKIGDGDANHSSSIYGFCVSKGGRRQTGKGRAGCEKGEKYEGAPMHYYKPFAPATGFHEGKISVQSHGCIHLGSGDAKWVWDWAEKGTRVEVHGAKSGGKPKTPAKPKTKKPQKKASLDILSPDEVAASGGEAALVDSGEAVADVFEAWWDEETFA